MTQLDLPIVTSRRISAQLQSDVQSFMITVPAVQQDNGGVDCVVLAESQGFEKAA